ncbi:MAG: hemolysin secretion protein, partial [Massilia sp.]|nr:hemolysin secretion protein [Massilia sp.]
MHFNELATSKATIPAILAAVVGVLAVLYAWRLPPFTSSIETTNNAYVKGKVTLIAPQLAGYVVDVQFTDYQPVKKGAVLIKLDDRIYQQQLQQAQATLAQQQTALANFEQNRASKKSSVDLATAQLAAAQAAVEKAQSDAGRSTSLLNSGLSPQSTADQVHAALLQARAGVDEAKASINIAQGNLDLVDAGKPSLAAAVKGAEAAVELARINLSNTRIVAPVDGNLGEVTARLGQYVAAGTQLTSVTPAQTWVIANFKETQLLGIKLGQPASLTVDAL